MLVNVFDLPFVKNAPHDGRLVYIAPYYDISLHKWNIFMPTEKGMFLKLEGAYPATRFYLSTQPENPETDPELPFGTFITQCFSFRGINGPFECIISDIENLSSILEIYHIISVQNESLVLMETQVEYLMFVVRSVYDLLQLISKNTSILLRSATDLSKKIIKGLPEDFAKICLSDDKPRTSSEIQEKWNLPAVLADFYVNETPYFLSLRETRNEIAHHGSQISMLFRAKEGIAVNQDQLPWSRFHIWNSQKQKENNLSSLRLFFASVISNAIELPNRYIKALSSCLSESPAAVHPEMKCFLKHPFAHHIVKLAQYLESPWEKE